MLRETRNLSFRVEIYFVKIIFQLQFFKFLSLSTAYRLKTLLGGCSWYRHIYRMIQTWGRVVAVCLTEGTAQVPSVVSLPFRATVLSCNLPSRAQIHCSPSLPSNNWTHENRVSDLSEQRWLLGPWLSIFKTRETWHNQNVWYIKQFVFRVPKSVAEREREGGAVRYQRLADALIGLNLTTWHSAQLRGLQPSTILFESQNGLAWLRDCKIILNNNCSSYTVKDAFHWRWARNEPVPSLYVECSSYTSGH